MSGSNKHLSALLELSFYFFGTNYEKLGIKYFWVKLDDYFVDFRKWTIRFHYVFFNMCLLDLTNGDNMNA